MYRKVLAIIKEINDKTMNPKAAQATLNAIAQEALKLKSNMEYVPADGKYM